MENINELRELFYRGIEEYKIEVDATKFDMLIKYLSLIKEWNNKINLTAIKDDKDFIIKHFIDSLSIMPYFENKNVSLIDVGTGAGFPGIPLKIVNDNFKITLMDSLDKRVKFLSIVIAELNLKNIIPLHSRAEDAGNNIKYREKYDYCVSRAVASLPVLLEYCLPFVKVGGFFIAMKGVANDEIDQSKKALATLGGEISDIKNFVLPNTTINRNLIIIRKIRQTSTKYPRKAGKPSQTPLI